MPIEIERKFLVSGDGWRDCIEMSLPIRQGYLARGDSVTTRVRTKGDRAFLTIKGATPGRARAEFEYEIPVADALAMLDLCGGKVLEKVRHVVVHAGKTWEVDEFSGRLSGLIVAEIELHAEDEAFAAPGWLGREVTDDIAYANEQLASAAQPPSPA